MTQTQGKLIVIEGLEGAGKSSVIQAIVQLLEKKGISTQTTREPGGTEIGELLRTIIKSSSYKNILHDKSELLLLYTSRIQLIEEIIKPALQSGQWIIADRFELSTLAYQGGGRGLSTTFIKQLSEFCLSGFKPDLTIYLDISPEEGMRRVRNRGEVDRIEQQTMDFFHSVHKAYLNVVQTQPDTVVIDGSLPMEEVAAHAAKLLNQFIESV